MYVESQPVPANRISSGRLWFGTCAGAVAWAVHGLISVMIATQACKDGSGSLGPLDPSGVRLLLGMLTFVLLLVAAAGAITSYRNWKLLAEDRNLTLDEGLGREDFMSIIGVFVGIVFFIGILWAGLPSLLIHVCVNAR
jgi:hypothetical protein